MVKFSVLVICAIVAGVVAEPPSSYLPPQARNSPSSVYGAPFGGFGSNGRNGNNGGKSSSFHAQRTGSKSFSYNSLHDKQFGSANSKSFGNGGAKFGSSNGFGSYNGNGASNGFGASRGISQQYGAPAQSFGASGSSFGSNGHNGISQQYGAPGQSFRASGSSFGSNGHNGISQQYGAPSQSFRASGSSFGSNGHNGISQQYGAPGQSFRASGSSFGSNGHNGISQQYGPPSFDFSGSSFDNKHSGNGFGSNSRAGFGAPAPVYGAPSFRNGNGYSKMDDDLAEPANYDFTYEVQAAEESGAEFGHQESREDESARGVYHVLLPDGRTQIVEYEADEEGFRPQIRYEEPSGYGDARSAQGPY